ncbi:kinesin-like protein KIN-7O [Rhododendron vialii]|uniref:kinesin-like protein KIN-7O n=1 Tax=Rhododendron vialii TaxID=182163 RepID=UPI00265DD9A4|nr:kinesin-like protein KIN-7O [Rhododendron vialii]
MSNHRNVDSFRPTPLSCNLTVARSNCSPAGKGCNSSKQNTLKNSFELSLSLTMERIHVTVRTRPLSPEDDKTSPWRISGKSISNLNHSSKFEFDRIFGESCKTQEVYEARTKNIVADAVCGYNGTVFAYGQTNSGKTHTMRGSTAEPGVIPRAVHDLFGLIQEDTDREFLLRMSYMEIYNEEIIDLLAPEHRKLQIHENLERGIFVAGLREETVASPEKVLEFMEFGESHRHIGETNMNLSSSRSHTIFHMIIESRNRCEDKDVGSSCDAVRVSVLNLVDLAGSERAAKTGAEGVRLKEGSHINKSLMTLGTVIKKLSEGAGSKGGHVRYRDSKLTRILQPALGGNANTAIICNITLAQIHADETKSSLQFASRALCVTNCACVNEILTDATLLKCQKKEIEELQHKISLLEVSNAELKGKLQESRIAFEHLAQRGLDAQVERTAASGFSCTCSRNSLCKTRMCRCQAGGGSCGVSCKCLSYRCLNR